MSSFTQVLNDVNVNTADLNTKKSVCLYKRDNRKTNQARIYTVNINKKNICFTYQYYIVCVATGNNCHTLKHAALDGRSCSHTIQGNDIIDSFENSRAITKMCIY
jgi:hypothetical protein